MPDHSQSDIQLLNNRILVGARASLASSPELLRVLFATRNVGLIVSLASCTRAGSSDRQLKPMWHRCVMPDSEKHFCSWLKVCPDNRISGGKLLSPRAGKTENRAAGMFRLAAQGAMQSKAAIGAFIRRIRPDSVCQRPLTLELTSSHDCSNACQV